MVEFVEFGGVSFVVEVVRDEYVEIGVIIFVSGGF